MALVAAWTRSACKVRAVTVRQSSPRSIRLASALPRSNQSPAGFHITVAKKNTRSIPATAIPASKFGDPTGSSLSFSFGGFSLSYAERPASALSISSSGTLRTTPSRVRRTLGDRSWATRTSSHSSAKLWSRVTRRGISAPLVIATAPDSIPGVRQRGKCFLNAGRPAASACPFWLTVQLATNNKSPATFTQIIKIPRPQSLSNLSHKLIQVFALQTQKRFASPFLFF